MPSADDRDLRQALLAVAVLDDVDLRPDDDALVLEPGSGAPEVLLPWATAAGVLGDLEPTGADARARLRSWLRAHAAVAALGAGAPDALAAALRPLALPPGSALHPGSAWVGERVLGGALDVGLGLVGLVRGESGTVPLWPDVAAVLAGLLDLADAAERAAQRREAMGALAVEHLVREVHWLQRGQLPGRPSAAVLRPLGGCDVPTLLASAALRAHLAREDGSGLRALAVPTRSRGWYDLARIDPVFVAAAWTATEPDQRGLPRPVLVTAEEVALAPVWRASGADLPRPPQA